MIPERASKFNVSRLRGWHQHETVAAESLLNHSLLKQLGSEGGSREMCQYIQTAKVVVKPQQ